MDMDISDEDLATLFDERVIVLRSFIHRTEQEMHKNLDEEYKALKDMQKLNDELYNRLQK